MTADIRPIPLDSIRIDGGTQCRAELNDDTVADYAAEIRSGVDFPPVVVFFDGSKYWLADGFHRFHAHRHAGAIQIDADVRNGTKRDAILHSAGANHDHGLRRSHADKRRAVEMLLRDKEWSQWSDREIARRCQVGHALVGTIRTKNNPVTGRKSSDETAPTVRKYVDKHGNESVMAVDGLQARATPAAAETGTQLEPAGGIDDDLPDESSPLDDRDSVFYSRDREPGAAPDTTTTESQPTQADRVAELERQVASLTAIAGADDKLAAALAKVVALEQLYAGFRNRISALTNEKGAAIARANHAEKKLKQAEKAIANRDAKIVKLKSFIDGMPV